MTSKNLEVAGPRPEAEKQESQELSKLDKIIMAGLAAGKRPIEIARSVYPDKKDQKKRYALRRKIIYRAARDQKLQQAIFEYSQGLMLLGLPTVSQAMVGRGGRGRTDAAKLVMEATGFHTPRSKQEHSGEIKIKLDMPRPPRTVDNEAETVTDAEVVED